MTSFGSEQQVCVCVCVCVCVQSISYREVAGSIPDDYGRTRLSGWLPTASVCRSMWCGVCRKNEKMKK